MRTTDPTDQIAALALLDEPKRRRLYEYVLASDQAVGRDEAAAATGVSRELAAFHLDRLAGAGMLSVEYRRLGGRTGPGAGRPAKLYRRAERDFDVSFPRRGYRQAAGMFAEALERQAGGAAAEIASVARAHGLETATEARPGTDGPLSRRQARTALLALLEESGYEPEVERGGKRVFLRNCPFDALVESHEDLTCGMNLAWAEGVSDALAETGLKASYASRPGRCCVVFEESEDRP